MDWVLLFIVFLVGLGTTFIGAISGGGGLLMRPILIFLGVPTITLIGTPRVAGILGDWPGLFLFHKHKKIDWNLAIFLTIPNLIGTIIAGMVVISLPTEALELFLGILLIVSGVVFSFNKNFGLLEQKSPFSKIGQNILGFIGTNVISFVGTITGGLGTLYISFYTLIYGKNYINAAGLWRISSYFGGLGSSVVFIWSGIVDWQLCLVLSAGFLIGSYFGTIYGLKKGVARVRYLVIALAFGAGIKLILF
ncbi:MAG: sulfite exporter TauE/SafE family protein [Candidatus Diapherotrites archaeon]